MAFCKNILQYYVPLHIIGLLQFFGQVVETSDSSGSSGLYGKSKKNIIIHLSYKNEQEGNRQIVLMLAADKTYHFVSF